MAFDDLPPNWTDLPLSTPHLAGDVVDLVVNESDRAQNTFAVLPCDEDDIGFPTPVLLDQTDWRVDAAERREMLGALAGIGVPGVVLAFSAPHRLPDEIVDGWRADAEAAFAAVGTRVIGVFSAWAQHVEPAPARV